MDDDIHMCMLFTYIFTISFILIILPPSHCQPQPPPDSDIYSECTNKFYNCGNLSRISYPFWGGDRPSHCGGWGYHLTCHDNQTTTFFDPPYLKVLDIQPHFHIMRLVRADLAEHVCSTLEDTDGNLPPFQYPASVHNITISYDCSSVDLSSPYNFTCGSENVSYVLPWEEYGENPTCKRHILVPSDAPGEYHDDGGLKALQGVLNKGFEVYYEFYQACERCNEKGGVCGSDDNVTHGFHCYFPPHKSKVNWDRKIIIGVVCAVLGALAVIAAGYFYWCRKKKKSYAISYAQTRSLSSDPSSKDSEMASQHFGLPIFTYTELEEATNYFDPSKELGEGGFGTVYFGKLRDGRCVAVKRLYENNFKRVEQFMNEVKILARLVHPNLVSLYGCTSRHSRELLLVYEYVPNGTVADHLHGKQAKSGKLPWHIRMDIAVETASALKYLHVKDIIHRDVKTNNILLDNHFRVKVADFGLSRLFPNHVTHVSTAPQGTPGYVDPEYHECYQLTNKSDVYSFGVVLIELISSLPAVDITRHRHEINLANMAINKIQHQALHELVDPTLGFESDYKVRKMINAVAELAFRCLHSSKDMRPSMDEVLNTLKDIQSDGKYKSQPEVMDISSSADDVVLLKDDPPPPSPDSNVVSKSTTPNASG